MKEILKAKYVLSFFLLLATLLAAAQPTNAPQQDDDFTAFLLLFATFFACMAIGAAAIGAAAATLLFLLLFALISIGIVSTSVAVGLYKRSVPAGFKTLLLIVFGTGCGVCGAGLALAVQHFYPLELPRVTAVFAGFAGGIAGGVVMGLLTFNVLQTLVKKITAKFSSFH